ncbi:hypothetical protein LJ656_27835 [Paraburkholderia sp. MMS20-SJTR3]|uniref:Uncharacterized protein n=1 Tax=Paraburkholderia sejongensis TaxID=2886946 RepID=A0ABS8K2S7_9BURK|nr:hypothetical protein [Paraburkholderia sp. MMS20-SJTR3]MCC8396408.1 hypothetical protein [Paraburkholderia sp. MMS20-SJTR3]
MQFIDLSPVRTGADADRAILFWFDDIPASKAGRRERLVAGAGSRNLTSAVMKRK